MQVEPSSPGNREERLNQVITEYLEAAELGVELDKTTLFAANPDLARELQEFLLAVAEVNRHTAPLRRMTAWAATETLPESFGDYEFLAQIGRGGMGVVCRARQKSLNRLVAVKLIRSDFSVSGMDGRRFRSEAAAAAHLEHPAIVPIYEIGEHDGRPFFSMKLFDGGNLAGQIRVCRAEPRRAAALVATISRAVHFAHQRGILHRDLKPSNILLDSDGRPHVADFSLAKWLDVDDGQTQTGMIIGTPAYMAPEQALPSQKSGQTSVVTTASDVYGLGAILYTLLVGNPPFRGLTPLDTLLAVRESEPLAPGKANQIVDRDLETICLKCLEKDPGRRYGSALALAEDLERWQAGEPILARPISGAERARRWCRRNPLLASMTATAALLLVFGAIALATGYVLVSQAEMDRRAAADAAADADRQAELSRRVAADVAELLQQLFRSPDPIGFEGFGIRGEKHRPAEVTARQFLDAAALEVTLRLNESPEVQAALFETIGNNYRSLGDYAAADQFLTNSLEIRRRLYGDNHAAVAASLFSMGMLRQDIGKYDEAEKLYREALDLQKRLIGPTDLAVARTELQLAWSFTQQFYREIPYSARNEEAEPFVRDALAICRQELGPRHREVGVVLATLAWIRRERGAGDEAETLMTEAFDLLERSEKEGEIGSATAYYFKAEYLRELHKYHEAVDTYQKVVEMTRRQLGEEHPVYALMLGGLAGTQSQAGDLVGAEKSIRESLAISRKSAMRSQPGVLDMFIRFADALRAHGDYAEAEALYQEVIKYGAEARDGASDRLIERARLRLDEMAKQKPTTAMPVEAPESQLTKMSNSRGSPFGVNAVSGRIRPQT